MAERPTAAQITSLVEAYAKNYWAAKLNAPMHAQQRLYRGYISKLQLMMSKFSNIDFTSDDFSSKMKDRARAWRNEHPFFGPGKDW